MREIFFPAEVRPFCFSSSPPPLTPFPSLLILLPSHSCDHEATLASVRTAQAEKDGHAADSAALAAFAYQARVARCAAEAELARGRRAAEASSATWGRRLEARQREVGFLPGGRGEAGEESGGNEEQRHPENPHFNGKIKNQKNRSPTSSSTPPERPSASEQRPRPRPSAPGR